MRIRQMISTRLFEAVISVFRNGNRDSRPHLRKVIIRAASREAACRRAKQIADSPAFSSLGDTAIAYRRDLGRHIPDNDARSVRVNTAFGVTLEMLVEDALRAIDNATGGIQVTLGDGHKAIDHDDAWLVIGTGHPFLRNKKDQRLLDKGEAPAYGDKDLRSFDAETICFWADELNETL